MKKSEEALTKNATERKECIDLLLNVGAVDISETEHPNKPKKRYLVLKLSKLSKIYFSFDYPEYDTVSVFHNQKIAYRGYKKFSEVKPMLVELGVNVGKN
jgi:hypothetical protein